MSMTEVPRILVPLDESDISAAVLPAAEKLAKALQARVVLLRVVPPPDRVSVAGSDFAPLVDVEERRAREELTSIAARSVTAGADIVVLVDRDPAAALLDWLRSHPVDYVVMATHGRSGVSHLLAGSVTEAVVRSGLAPVLAIRPMAAVARR